MFNLIEGLATENITTIIKATLLVVLSISGNFLAETLGCQSQKWLSNMYVKHILIIFMIYFTIDFTQPSNHVENPLINIGKAFAVWVFFHFCTHMDIIPTVITILLLMGVFVISNYTIYLKSLVENLDKNQEKTIIYYNDVISKLDKAKDIAFILSLIITVIGFLMYFFEKRTEYKNHFSMVKFIFGVKNCKHVK